MMKKLIIGFVVAMVCVGIYNVYKPLPENINLAGAQYQVLASEVRFFTDRTFIDASGTRQSEQEIFDEVFRMIRDADAYVLIDMFLFNNFLGTATTSYRQLSDELVDTLIAKKQANPAMVVQVITDPLNTLYGGYESEQLRRLSEAGIIVTITKLTALRDSNPLYSALWRTVLRWMPVGLLGDVLPNLLDAREGDVGIDVYLTMLNFKANHRKIIVADYVREDGSKGMSTFVMSANPHDGSSAHTNTALRVDGYLWNDALTSEKAVTQFSESTFSTPLGITDRTTEEESALTVQLLTEKSIKNAILKELESLSSGDRFDMAMFYFSDRDIVRAIKDADTRGVQIRIILDPNKDAFGREKGGVPNRQVAHELAAHSGGNTSIRWCDTHGEQCHTKLLLFTHGDTQTVIQGSANLTRRNINNLNLETDIYVHGSRMSTLFTEIQSYFDSSWSNEEGRIYTTQYETYADTRFTKKVLYRFGEFTGISSY